MNITGWFTYGSQIYGNVNEDSDTDFCYIGGDTSIINPDNGIHLINGDDTFSDMVTSEQFNELLKQHHPVMLEGYSLQYHDNLKGKYQFSEKVIINIQLPILRKSFSTIASNSFVKARKKLMIAKDYNRYASMKSLFHSLRLLQFGTQIAMNGYIVDFRECNNLHEMVVKDYTNYSDSELLSTIIPQYKIIYNEYATEFRKYAPKC